MIKGKALILFCAFVVACAGEAGPVGPPGPAGPPGATGPGGKDGAPGSNGTNGANGTDGAPGSPGADGRNGSDGKNGENGKDATPTRITATIHCGGNLEDTAIWFSYDVAQFSDGFVFCSADVSLGDLQSSNAKFFAPAQVGWATAPIVMTFDVAGTAGGGWWRISLDRNSLTTSIDYNDSEVAGGKKAWTMTPDKCVVNTY